MASICEMFLSKFSEAMLAYYQEAKIKEIIFYFNFSRLGKMQKLGQDFPT